MATTRTLADGTVQTYIPLIGWKTLDSSGSTTSGSTSGTTSKTTTSSTQVSEPVYKQPAEQDTYQPKVTLAEPDTSTSNTTYRQLSDGSYQIFLPILGWRDAPADFSPSAGDTNMAGTVTAEAPEQNTAYNPPTQQDVVITGNGQTYTSGGVYDDATDPDHTTALTLEQAKLLRDQSTADEWIAKWTALGATATFDPATGYYTITDAQGQKYRTNSPTSVHPDIRAAFGMEPTTDNPWYEGGDGPGGIPGPLVVTPEYPDGGPMPGSDDDPTRDTWWPQPTGGGGGGGTIIGGGGSPINTTTRPGMTLDTVGGEYPYNPPEGIPLNPMVFENPMKFSPYGTPAASFSNIAQFGGLPRSTGPWNEMGGYYGGNPYTQPPENYPGPPSNRSPYMPIDSPWDGGIGGGGQPPDSESPWFPPAQYVPPGYVRDPATGQIVPAPAAPTAPVTDQTGGGGI